MQSEKEIIIKVTAEIKAQFEGEGTGHDWWHIIRVVNTAKQIAKEEGANSFIVELSALLHDLGDHKFHKEKDAAEKLISEMLDNSGVSEKLKNQVLEIVSNVSYKGANVETRPTSLEGKVVQDADRLDAIGAIGIARAFAYGGNKERLLYHPNQPPVVHDDFNAYKNDKGHTINHFYEKLLLLKDRMQTKSGKEMAEERHQYMEGYLKQFYKEWNWK
ncbi:MAG: HD domain-containing protein [Flavobacteriales bacterium]|nr:HD domain-containing protein [Flavobacteriales bacterium]